MSLTTPKASETIEFTTRLTRAILYLASDRLSHLKFSHPNPNPNPTKAFAFKHPHTITSVEAEKEALSARGAALVDGVNRRCSWWRIWKENPSSESERLLRDVMVWFFERFEESGWGWGDVEMLEGSRVV